MSALFALYTQHSQEYIGAQETRGGVGGGRQKEGTI